MAIEMSVTELDQINQSFWLPVFLSPCPLPAFPFPSLSFDHTTRRMLPTMPIVVHPKWMSLSQHNDAF